MNPGHLTLTTHASCRMQQRSIREEGIELVLDFGIRRHCRNGCTSYSFDKRSWKAAMDSARGRAASLERFRNLYVVVAGDGAIVTVSWRH